MSAPSRPFALMLSALLVFLIAAPLTAAGPAAQGMAITRAEADKATAGPGDEVRFLLQLQSTGDQSLQGVELEYIPPAGLELVTASASRDAQITLDTQRLMVLLEDIPPQDRVEITIVVRVGSQAKEGAALVNHFTVTSGAMGSQEAVVALSIAGRQSAASLPQAGSSLSLLLVGIGLAAGVLILHHIRARSSPAR